MPAEAEDPVRTADALPSPDEGARHSSDWYRERLGVDVLRPGARLMIPCDGGPSRMVLEQFPPRIEIEIGGGLYVLADEGPVHSWRYHFVSKIG